MKHLSTVDPDIAKLIEQEGRRQADTLMMIPSENYASKAVEEAVGSCLENKYAEGYPGKRYYQGQEFVDQIEQLAVERAKQAYQVPYANVQAYSGSPANTAVFFALLKPGDKVMGLELSHGGHLTHGYPKVTFSGSYFDSVQYQVAEHGFIDYDALEKQVLHIKPKLLIAGTTAYPRALDFERFAAIAEKVDAYLLADISHISGLVIGGVHQSPAAHAHIITSTTHKTLRGPRGALILGTEKGFKKNPKLDKKINSAIIPGLQGGPHLNNIAGIAVALQESMHPNFKDYAQQIVKNAAVLAEQLLEGGLELVSGGTDNHLLVADVRPLNMKGKEAAVLLEKAGIVCNYNTVPYDPNPPFNPSGIRLGTPALTSRGMKEAEMKQVGQWIVDVLKKQQDTDSVSNLVKNLCKTFPIPERYNA